jgi:hypothetical protein
VRHADSLEPVQFEDRVRLLQKKWEELRGEMDAVGELLATAALSALSAHSVDKVVDKKDVGPELNGGQEGGSTISVEANHAGYVTEVVETGETIPAADSSQVKEDRETSVEADHVAKVVEANEIIAPAEV